MTIKTNTMYYIAIYSNGTTSDLYEKRIWAEDSNAVGRVAIIEVYI